MWPDRFENVNVAPDEVEATLTTLAVTASRFFWIRVQIN